MDYLCIDKENLRRCTITSGEFQHYGASARVKCGKASKKWSFDAARTRSVNLSGKIQSGGLLASRQIKKCDSSLVKLSVKIPIFEREEILVCEQDRR